MLQARPEAFPRFKYFREELLLFLKNYATSEGDVSPNVINGSPYYTRYQVSLCANDHFDALQNVCL